MRARTLIHDRDDELIVNGPAATLRFDAMGTRRVTGEASNLSGTVRTLIGFVAGALFALLPVYYYYMGRDAALRSAPAVPPLEFSRAAGASGDPQPVSFTPRLSYELAHVPKEVPKAPPPPPPAPIVAVPVVVTPPAASAPAPAPAAPAVVVKAAPAVPAPESTPGPRIANARPIRAEPLESRDTTREIARETQKPAPVEKAARPAPERVPKAIEARTVIAKVETVPPPPEPHAVVSTAEPVVPQLKGAAAGDLVQTRFSATRDWLSAAPETTHTIQIMGIGSDAQLKAHLQALSKTLEPNKIFVFRTVAQGKPWITVVYGAYPDKKSALEALAKLPPTISATKPVLRTVNGIRVEMKQNGTS